MADKDPDSGDGPSLELPSLGLGSLRRRKRDRRAPATPVVEPQSSVVELVETTRPDPVSTGSTSKTPIERLPGAVSAALTGALSGLVIVGAVRLALRGCDAVRGTDTCGGPGFFLLVAILVVTIVLATWLLRRLGRDDAGTVALMGVGLTAVIALAVLAGQLLSPWMLLVIPAMSVVSFLVAHWVSTTVTDD